MRGLEFVIILLVGAALAWTVRDDLQRRDANASLSTALTASLQAAKADTAGASQGQLRCSTEARSAVNVGRAIGRIAAPRHGVGTADATRPMVSAADIRSVVQP